MGDLIAISPQESRAIKKFLFIYELSARGVAQLSINTTVCCKYPEFISQLCNLMVDLMQLDGVDVNLFNKHSDVKYIVSLGLF